MKKGFTIIELLVVIAIIGILASVVLGSLSSARSHGQIDSQAAMFPEATNYVVDSAGVLSADTVAKLNADLKAYDSSTTAQVAVVTVKTTSPLALEDYSIQLADKFKAGQKGVDNGVILLIATEDRKIRIEVGRGVEDKITDSDAGNIIRDAISPKLHTGDWDGGVKDGVATIINELNK